MCSLHGLLVDSDEGWRGYNVLAVRLSIAHIARAFPEEEKEKLSYFMRRRRNFTRQRFSSWKGFDPDRGEDEAMGLPSSSLVRQSLSFSLRAPLGAKAFS